MTLVKPIEWRRLRRLVGCLLLIGMPIGTLLAATPADVLADANLELRARHLGRQLRCVVCQNQAIDNSNAPLARDLRVLLRERLQGGDSDAQAVAFIVARYGNFVLLKPPFQANTLVLWLGPAILLLVAGVALRMLLDRRRGGHEHLAVPSLTAEEKSRLSRLLEGPAS